MSLEVSFADPEGGVLGFCEVGARFDSGAPSAALFRNGEETGGGGFEVVSQDDAGVRLEAEGWGLEIEHSSRGEPVSFGPDSEAGAVSGVTLELATAEVTGRVWDSKGELGIHCPGVTRLATGSVDWPQTSLLRILAVPLDDGGLLALAAARPTRAEGHGEEGVSCALSGAGGSHAPAAEALLSTQYDAAGEHVRVGLELELSTEDEEPPLRGAATRLCGTRIERPGMTLDCAFFRWELDGRAGTGRYDIVTRA